MSHFVKRIALYCYGITLVMFTIILFWGMSGIFMGGGQRYRLFTYALIPAVTGIAGLALGVCNSRAKWPYPVFAGVLAYLVPSIVTGRIAVLLGVPYFIYPFISALVGLCAGVIFCKMRGKNKIRLKKFTKVVLAAVIAVAAVHIIHALTLDRIVQYTEISFNSPNIAPELDGYRIAFISDTHLISDERLWGVVNELNRRELDLVILGGDFARNTGIMQNTVRILSHIEATDGIYGVEGNHDRHFNLFPAMEAHGMIPLSNSGYHIRDGFFLAGTEDMWNRRPNISRAIEGTGASDFVILVSHNPDVTMRQDTAGVDLILSAHTHGGQIAFFGIWAPYFTATRSLTAYGQRFRGGWAESRDGVPVFVSRGVGEYLPRVFARPQVVIFTLYTR